MNILINMYKTELLAHRWCIFLLLPKCFTGWLFQFTLSSAERTCFCSPLLWLILSNFKIFAKMICEKYNLICISIHITGVGHLFTYLLIRFGLIQACCKEQVYSCESFSRWVRPANLPSGHLLMAMLCFILIFRATGILDSPWLYLCSMLRVQKSDLNISSTSQGTWGILACSVYWFKAKAFEDWIFQLIILVLSFYTNNWRENQVLLCGLPMFATKIGF